MDSLNPDFLDPCIAGVESDLMLALWALLKPQQSGAPFGAKALQMLGKLGGRIRGFLREPLELEAKSNPEHGLRLILTFKPETSFLVPLDRCIALMKTILAAPPVPNLKGAEALVEHRRSTRFLRACLASVLNVAAAPRARELCARDPRRAGGRRCRAGSAIPTPKPRPRRRRRRRAVALGNKTKTQLEAEKGVFKQLLTAVVAAEADPTLKQANDGFVDAVSEHFAMLFVSGWRRCSPARIGAVGCRPWPRDHPPRAAPERRRRRRAATRRTEEGKKDKKSKTPPPPSPKKTRGRRGKKDEKGR